MNSKSWMTLAIALLSAGGLAVAAQGAEIDSASNSFVQPQGLSVPFESPLSEEELLIGFFDRSTGLVETQGITVSPRSDALSANDKIVYDYLREQIAKIAAGTVESTVIRVPMSLLGVDWGHTFTEEELGVSGCTTYDPATDKWVENKAPTNQAFEALYSKIAVDSKKVFRALTADSPYELYWMGTGKNVNAFSYSQPGIRSAYSYSNGITSTTFSFGDDYALLCTFKPGVSYKGGSENTVDTQKTTAASAAAKEAKKVVVDAQDLSDYDKLATYKEYICNAVSYNEEAKGHIDDIENWGYSDPWQLIWVFDKNPATNVVCEGYSKAFQYLCDLTAFDDPRIDCISPSGDMDGGTGAGPHMWNIVTMEDGNRYLVDVTNSDEGSVGASDPLFLKGYASAAFPEYTFAASNASIKYTYNEQTQALYSTAELTIASSDYQQKNTAEPSFRMKSLTLGGDIGVNFFVDLSGITDDSVRSNSYMEFTVNGETQTAAFNESFKNTAKTCYGFTCYVTSIQFASEINAVYHYGDKTIETQFSVADYIKSYEKVADAYPAVTTQLVHALQDYGHYAREYLNSVNGFGDKYKSSQAYTINYTDSECADVKNAAAQYAFTASKNKDIAAISYALYLDSNTSIAVYVTPASEYSGSVTADGYSAVKQADGRYKILIEGISAHKLNEKKTIIITTDSGDVTVTVCALSLCNSILSSDNPDAVSKNLAVSLYKYWDAANTYKS